ncbi:uncharacterized protein C5orf34 homolog [Syngnathoides biaculeatus]|uniref:uncharacterized protein C5orf34 homolog n=1 Tax=Syngnathoides biaculeatus TaxID=300417 RepID=UPI002ADE67BF|nr:uncharacterized protein C5orf34 homolog [Syngnathoides biaculeatus]
MEASMMIMYEDESVYIRYGNGTQLQLSPCGSEFVLVKAALDSGLHQLQTAARVRQRTRFTISAYKELIVAALAFRNKYASRPYLPEELTSPAHKQYYSNLEVQWPSWSSCEAESGPGGETIIKSEDKRAHVTLSPSGQDFFVEYACRFSQPLRQQPPGWSRDPESIADGQELHASAWNRKTAEGPQIPSVEMGDVHQAGRNKSCSARVVTDEVKPEDKYQSVPLVQHHSCLAVAPPWCYPVSLARRYRASRLCGPPCGEERTGPKAEQILNASDLNIEERKFVLPEALPLVCPSPHFHSWKFQDLVAESQPDQISPTELVKVMWHQGVTYRILDQDVSVIEVSPGDGSVIRSNGVLNTYFTHYKPECQSSPANVKEITYHVNGLPPDIPGQVYSICSVVSCASRLLARYDKAKKWSLPTTTSCMPQQNVFKATTVDAHVSHRSPPGRHENDRETVKSRSDVAAAELANIQRCNSVVENGDMSREKGCAPNGLAGITYEEVCEGSIAEALQRTSKAIKDIEEFLTAAKMT